MKFFDDSHSDIPISDSVLTESICSVENSSRHSSDVEISPKSNISEGESKILRRNAKTLESKLTESPIKPKKLVVEVEKYPRKRHSYDELLTWTKRLEEKENRLKELEKEAIRTAAKKRLAKPLKSVKISVKDRSTSPFQFPDLPPSATETSIHEALEGKISSSISEAIEESISKIEETNKTESIAEKIEESITEVIPEKISKNTVTSTSKTMEYSESFESPTSSETRKNKTPTKPVRTDPRQKEVAIKLALSPRILSPRRRYSSGSDDSLNFSYTGTNHRVTSFFNFSISIFLNLILYFRNGFRTKRRGK